MVAFDTNYLVRHIVQDDVSQARKVQEILNCWAFLAGVPLKPDGSEMDYRSTIHMEAINEGAFDGGIFALLQKRDGQWMTVRYIIGATDVPYVDWPQEFGAPAVIFE